MTRGLLLVMLLALLSSSAVLSGRVTGVQPELTFLFRSAGGSDIVMMDVGHAHIYNLTRTRSSAADRDPAWSPDGRKLAFVSDRGGQPQLYLWEMSAPLGRTPLIPSRIAPGYRPVWSPDGLYLAVEFVRGRVGIYIIDTRCVRQTPPCPMRRLTEHNTDDRFPVWSPDGDQIAFVSWEDGSADIYIASPHGGSARNLTRGNGWNLSPSWSPDGSQIAFFSDRDGYRELHLMGADGGNLRQLTDDNNPYNAQASGAPVWSPDGRWLAYAFTFEGNLDIMIIPANCADGQPDILNCRQTTTRVSPSAGTDIAPFWSADSQSIEFISDRRGSMAVFRAQVACPACPAQMLTGTGYDTLQASWRPRR